MALGHMFQISTRHSGSRLIQSHPCCDDASEPAIANFMHIDRPCHDAGAGKEASGAGGSGKMLGLLLKTAPRRKRSAAVIHEIPVHQDFAVQEAPKRLRRASDGSHPLPLLVNTFLPAEKPSGAPRASVVT